MSLVYSVKPFKNFIPIACSIVIKGDNAKQIRASYQQNPKPIPNPTKSAKNASTYGPTLSVLTSFIIEDPYAIAEVNTLKPFSLKSWNPYSF
jgi:hypothetical protein